MVAGSSQLGGRLFPPTAKGVGTSASFAAAGLSAKCCNAPGDPFPRGQRDEARVRRKLNISPVRMTASVSSPETGARGRRGLRG